MIYHGSFSPTPEHPESGTPVRPTRPRERWREEDPDLLESMAEEITALSAELSAVEHRLLVLIRDFDEREGWKRAGFASCADWLAHQTGLNKVTARARVRVARALARLPEISGAMASGELSISQVRALTRAADPETESELLSYARSMTASNLERFVRGWRRGSRADEARIEEARHEARCLSIFPRDDGSYAVAGTLEPEIALLVMRAIDAASDTLYRGSAPETTPEQRRADALALVAERALAAGFAGGAVGGPDSAGSHEVRMDGEPRGDSAESRDVGIDGEPRRDAAGSSRFVPVPLSGGRSGRYRVHVHVEAMTLKASSPIDDDAPAYRSELDDGSRVSPEAARRMACDATVVQVTHAPDGRVVDVGRQARTLTPIQRRLLEARDRGCRFPGCGSRHCHAHHIVHWADGGPTELDNMILLCGTHHRLLHEGGFYLEYDPPGSEQPTFFSPTGVKIRERPPRMWLHGRPVEREEVLDADRAVAAKPRELEWERDVPLGLYLRMMRALGL